jgi:hypothetical protein
MRGEVAGRAPPFVSQDRPFVPQDKPFVSQDRRKVGASRDGFCGGAEAPPFQRRFRFPALTDGANLRRICGAGWVEGSRVRSWLACLVAILALLDRPRET